jgi:hypothetical protein
MTDWGMIALVVLTVVMLWWASRGMLDGIDRNETKRWRH